MSAYSFGSNTKIRSHTKKLIYIQKWQEIKTFIRGFQRQPLAFASLTVYIANRVIICCYFAQKWQQTNETIQSQPSFSSSENNIIKWMMMIP